MIRKIKLFWELPHREKRLFVEAFFLLGLMRALILTVSFKRLTRALTHAPDHIDQGGLSDSQRHTAQSIGKIISKAAQNTPWESACLAQVLTAQKMLSKRNIPGVFFLGAKRDGPVKEELEAHAWTQCDDLIITGEPGHESFKVLSVYGWGSR